MTILIQQGQSNKSISVKYNILEDSGTGFPIEPPRGSKNGLSHSSSMIHPNAVGYLRTRKEENAGETISGSTNSSSRHDRAMNRQSSQRSRVAAALTSNEIMSRQETMVCFILH